MATGLTVFDKSMPGRSTTSGCWTTSGCSKACCIRNKGLRDFVSGQVPARAYIDQRIDKLSPTPRWKPKKKRKKAVIECEDGYWLGGLCYLEMLQQGSPQGRPTPLTFFVRFCSANGHRRITKVPYYTHVFGIDRLMKASQFIHRNACSAKS